MARETQPFQTWMAAHPQQYEALFDDGRTQELDFSRPPEQMALSAITRHTFVQGKPPLTEHVTMPEVEQGVNATIEASNQGLFGEPHDILSGLNHPGAEAFKFATTRIITQWERACRRRGVTSPFESMIIADICPDDVNLEATQLTLMVAAALATVVQKFGVARNSDLIPGWAVNGIKYYGPAFTTDVILGNDLTEVWGASASRANASLTVARRKNILFGSAKRPVKSLEKINAKLSEIPSSEELAVMLGWTTERTEAIFTPGSINQLAYYRRDTPLIEDIRRIAYLYDEVLTTENITDRLGITELQAKNLFGSDVIRMIVFSSPDADPVKRLQNVLELTRELTNSFRISHTLAAWLASNLPSSARDRARLVEAERSNRPAGVSERLWDSLTAKYPAAGDPRRLREVGRVRRYWDFLNSVSLNAVPENNRSLEERLPDNTYSPEHILFGDDAASKLKDTTERLMSLAGLSPYEKNRLLEFFAQEQEQEPPLEISALIERVKQASTP